MSPAGTRGTRRACDAGPEGCAVPRIDEAPSDKRRSSRKAHRPEAPRPCGQLTAGPLGPSQGPFMGREKGGEGGRGGVTRYILRRLLQTVPVLFGVSLLAFAIMHVVPGD